MSKPTATTKTIAVLDQEPTLPAVWLGLDVAAATFDAALDVAWATGRRSAPLHELPTRRFENSREGARACLAWAREQLRAAGLGERALRAAMESTGNYSLGLLLWLVDEDAALAPALLNPKQSADYLKSRSPRRKDDPSDARGLARLASEREPAPADVPRGPRFELREILRLRTALVAERDAHRDRARKLHEGSGKQVRAILEKLAKAIQSRIQECEKAARKLLKNEPALAADAARLAEIFGVGELTAMTVVAELGDLRRFASAAQLACYCGTTPRTNESGTRAALPRLSNAGNRHVRRSLYMCAAVIYRHNKCALGAWYHRKVAQGMPAMKAHAATMRKLLALMWTIVTRNLTYERFPQHDSQQGA